MQPPVFGDDWLAIIAAPLPIGAVYDWTVRPSCGAVVMFSGTVRDHAEGRDNVQFLEYEVYEAAALERFGVIAAAARRRWPMIGRIAMLHRVGRLELEESAVVVAVSTPHRGDAFEAARHLIDVLKTSVPIWKHETWRGGADWGTDTSVIENVGSS